MKRMQFVYLAIMLVLITSCGGGSSSNVKIEDAWVRSATVMNSESQNTDQAEMSQSGEMGHMAGSNSAAYMVIVNNGSEPDRLLKAYSDIAHSTELHVSEEKDGVMTMHPVESVEVPANGKAELKPGGYHVMLIGIKKDLVAGEKLNLTLEFEKAGTIQVEAEVRAP